jgi:hypothetical protein
MTEYSTLLLPKTLSPLLARRFAALNVEAIRAIRGPSVSIFIYSPQFTRTIKSWEEELRQPGYNCYVLVTPNPETGATTLEEAHWVGLWVLRGPLEADSPDFPQGISEPAPSGAVQTQWFGTRLYVKESHRSLHVLGLMNQAVYEHMVRHARSEYKASPGMLVNIRLRLTAYLDTNAHQYYTTTGAKTLLTLSSWEHLDRDGILEQVPEEFLPSKDLSEPVISIMEYELPITI